MIISTMNSCRVIKTGYCCDLGTKCSQRVRAYTTVITSLMPNDFEFNRQSSSKGNEFESTSSSYSTSNAAVKLSVAATRYFIRHQDLFGSVTKVLGRLLVADWRGLFYMGSLKIRDKMGLHFYSATLSDAVFLNLVMAVLTVTAAAVLSETKNKDWHR
jgi:hypothetical protein